MKNKDEELEAWFRQNITDSELIKWYKAKTVQYSNWLDKLEKSIDETEAKGQGIADAEKLVEVTTHTIPTLKDD